MKILLDECVTKHLKPHLNGFEVFTVREMQWSGIKNGKLMSLCVSSNFDILLTIDKNLQYQQNLDKYPLTIVVFNSYTSKAEELISFLPAFREKLSKFKKHKAYVINKTC
ncbi:DUF5615 family PIN-like protein [uncultured Mucilaginibacter sp.]|uniref:DUF5615 family PIN-like protein n=1 Tax=uncultured Mucilaginibacter sp. TaxID=797541 RepID=UPI002636A01A|nr:DUF5615 family PIN-like protein [uncultured Mucilaginibacter sp.]